MQSSDSKTDIAVLIVDDERSVADAFATQLEDNYQVQTAHTAEEALECIHPGIDVVLLDRRLPGMSGDEFLGRIRGHETDYQVAMISAIDPTEEILKLDIDEYVVKPSSREELHSVVEEMVHRAELEQELRTYLGELSKKQVLEAERSLDELVSNQEYRKLLHNLADRRMSFTETLARQAEPRTDPEHHYSVREC